jgi:hypothetical protein
MQRIQPIEPQQADAELRNIYQECEETWGSLPNSLKTLGHSPQVLRTISPFFATLQGETMGSVLDGKIKELCILKTSIMNECNH